MASTCLQRGGGCAIVAQLRCRGHPSVCHARSRMDWRQLVRSVYQRRCWRTHILSVHNTSEVSSTPFPGRCQIASGHDSGTVQVQRSNTFISFSKALYVSGGLPPFRSIRAAESYRVWPTGFATYIPGICSSSAHRAEGTLCC